MSVHPWTHHEIARLRHEERIARASTIGTARRELAESRAHAGALRRYLLSDATGSLRRRFHRRRRVAATAAPRPS